MGDPTARELAAQTGLGRMTEGGSFMTDEFGTGVEVGVLATDAPLDSTPPVSEAAPPHAIPELTGKALRQRLEYVAREHLVTLFGAAQVESFEPLVAELRGRIRESELGERVVDASGQAHGPWISKIIRDPRRIRGPLDYLPTARTVLVIGMPFADELIANSGLATTRQIGTYAFHQYQTCFELRYAASVLARELERHNQRVVVTENLLGLGSFVDTPRGILPDARSGALEAVVAGLGRIGRNGALLTPEHGPHQRVLCLITDAELPADPVALGPDPCEGCMECMVACPMQALTHEAFEIRLNGATQAYPVIERHRCDWAKAYSLNRDEGPILIGNLTHVAAPETPVTIEDLALACELKDPVLKHRSCILEPCLRRCPAGRNGAERARM